MTAIPKSRLLATAAICAIASLATARDSAAQGGDRLAGTWHLNVAQSTYASAGRRCSSSTT